MKVELDVDELHVNDTISGAGTLADPLKVDKPYLLAVNVSPTLIGDGTLNSPLAVANPGITEVVVDGSLTGNGTVQSPLTVANPGISGITVDVINGLSVPNVTKINVSQGTLTQVSPNEVTITTGGGGGGGSPGGNPGTIQFNDEGSFGGKDTFKFDEMKNLIISTENGNVDPAPSITIKVGETESTAGNLLLQGSDAFNFTGIPSDVEIRGGHAGLGFFVFNENNGGNVRISSGNTTGGTSGSIINTIGSSLAGAVGSFRISGDFTPNVAIADINTFPDFGGGLGVVFIQDNVVLPSSDPVGGGYLYVEAGALKWRGSGGTISTIAPA